MPEKIQHRRHCHVIIWKVSPVFALKIKEKLAYGKVLEALLVYTLLRKEIQIGEKKNRKTQFKLKPFHC